MSPRQWLDDGPSPYIGEALGSMEVQSITGDTIGMLFVGALLALGIKLVLDHFSKRAAEKRKAEQRATFKSWRDQSDDKRPTMVEAFESELEISRRRALPNEDETERYNALYAHHIMEDDLGRYALGPKPYEVDQAHRDILLAHARRDAAEALATSRTLLREVRGLENLSGTLYFWLCLSSHCGFGGTPVTLFGRSDLLLIG
jgi:hypothetical protein